jgi:hypothetical protein
MPPAITLPSCPAVLAPMACIRMKGGQEQRAEDAELARGAQEGHLRLGEQWAEVDHCPDPDEGQEREELGTDAGLVHHPEEPVRARQAGQGKVGQDTAEPNRQQQDRFLLLDHCQRDQDRASQNHDRVPNREVAETLEQLGEETGQVHRFG